MALLDSRGVCRSSDWDAPRIRRASGCSDCPGCVPACSGAGGSRLAASNRGRAETAAYFARRLPPRFARDGSLPWLRLPIVAPSAECPRACLRRLPETRTGSEPRVSDSGQRDSRNPIGFRRPAVSCRSNAVGAAPDVADPSLAVGGRQARDRRNCAASCRRHDRPSHLLVVGAARRLRVRWIPLRAGGARASATTLGGQGQHSRARLVHHHRAQRSASHSREDREHARAGLSARRCFEVFVASDCSNDAHRRRGAVIRRSRPPGAGRRAEREGSRPAAGRRGGVGRRSDLLRRRDCAGARRVSDDGRAISPIRRSAA